MLKKLNVAAVLITLVSTISSAQVVRTFVSTSGSDANPCTKALPCRNFNAAITAVDARGEVIPLDTGGYGPVTIAKSVSLISPSGIHAAIAPTSGDAITVLNTLATDVVILRGLSLSGLGASGGINYFNAGKLFVENCVINGFFSNGIRGDFLNSTALSVKDTVIRNNGASGIVLASGDGTALIDHCRLEGNTNDGLFLFVAGNVTARNCVSSNNNYGFRVNAQNTGLLNIEDSIAVNNAEAGFVVETSGGAAEINMERCRSSHNGIGIQAVGGGAVVRVSASAITNNSIGIVNDLGGFVLSRLNNTLEGNGVANTFGPNMYSAK